MPNFRSWFILFIFLCCSSLTQADDVVESRLMLPELAMDIAAKTLSVCRKKGYQVAVVVVDRAANVQALLRDVYASRFTIELAQRKANAVILSGVNSSELRKNRKDIRQELNSVSELLLLAGGLPIRSGGFLLGAVGVSGAPGGDIDAECAQVALAGMEERLEFAE